MGASDLLLAFHVRTLAVELHSKARSSFYQTLYARFEADMRAASLSEWDRDHPIEMYIDAALHELRGIAVQIQPFIQP